MEIHTSPCTHHPKLDCKHFPYPRKLPPTSFQPSPYLPALQEVTLFCPLSLTRPFLDFIYTELSIMASWTI